MELSLRDRQGKDLRKITVADEVFGLTPNLSVLHQTFLAQMAARRQGTHDTKGRGEVRGSTRKLFKQKGLGRARQGSVRAPHRKGGGIVFGPTPRDYTQTIPKRMRRLALRSALSAKARDGALAVIDDFGLTTPRTKDMVAMLSALGLEGSVMVVTAEPDAIIKQSASNVPRVLTTSAAYLNVADLMNHRHLVMTEAAVRAAELLWGGERATRRREPAVQGAA